MLKISHKAIAENAKVRSNAGASAIFKLFTARPALLEKRINRPSETAAVAVRTAAAVAVAMDGLFKPERRPLFASSTSWLCRIQRFGHIISQRKQAGVRSIFCDTAPLGLLMF